MRVAIDAVKIRYITINATFLNMYKISDFVINLFKTYSTLIINLHF